MDNRRNKCYDINKTYNHYYLTQDEDNNYQFKQCLTNCKICTNNEICNECNEQYHSIRNSTKCIPDLDCKLIIYTEDSTLDEFTNPMNIAFFFKALNKLTIIEDKKRIKNTMKI